mmetsp:Transcript_490/g.1159  ORF Transcript_490/g.1159 Transcript_490/m.1159 type:complete len:223 (+) Transcript_490:97-765(+)
MSYVLHQRLPLQNPQKSPQQVNRRLGLVHGDHVPSAQHHNLVQIAVSSPVACQSPVCCSPPKTTIGLQVADSSRPVHTANPRLIGHNPILPVKLSLVQQHLHTSLQQPLHRWLLRPHDVILQVLLDHVSMLTPRHIGRDVEQGPGAAIRKKLPHALVLVSIPIQISDIVRRDLRCCFHQFLHSCPSGSSSREIASESKLGSQLRIALSLLVLLLVNQSQLKR